MGHGLNVARRASDFAKNPKRAAKILNTQAV